MADVLREHVAEMISGIMRTNGWSASRVAKEAGVAPSTITRALDPASSFTPSGATVNKLVPLLAQAKVTVDNQNVDLQTQLADRYTDQYKKGGALPVVGDIEAGVWKDQAFNTGRPQQIVTLLDPAWEGKSIVAYRIVGDHTDRDLPSGSIVIVERGRDVTFREGDICVMRRKVHFLGSQKFETTLWNFDVRDGETIALPRAVGGGPELEKINEPVLAHDMEFQGVVVATYHRLDRESKRIIPTKPSGIR